MEREFTGYSGGGYRGGYRGKNFNPNFHRDRADRSDRRYDDFYADRSERRDGPPGPRNAHAGHYNSNKPWNNRRGGGPPRAGDKRRNDFNSKFAPSEKKGRESSSHKEKQEPKPLKEEPVPDIPDEEVIVPDLLMDNVERLRQRKEVERNAADEDVQKLVVFCYTGKGYLCRTCGLLLTKESSFVSHLNGKSHVMNVITARTEKKYQEVRDILDIDLSPDEWFEENESARAIIMRQSKVLMKVESDSKAKAEANFNKIPSNFFGFNMELRKSVSKKADKVVITSLVESTVEVTDFTGERFFGCEFVRAVTGFHCRLCSINIREAKGVLPHVDSKQHKNNYAAYIKRNADYEKSQKEQSDDLFSVMLEHDGKHIVLAESASVADSHFLSVLDNDLVRIPEVMNPELKKKEKEEKEKKEKEEKEAAEKEANEKGETEGKEADEVEKEREDGGDEEDGGEKEEDGDGNEGEEVGEEAVGEEEEKDAHVRDDNAVEGEEVDAEVEADTEEVAVPETAAAEDEEDSTVTAE